MNGHRAYQQQRDTGLTRIDLILDLYARALDNLDRAEAARVAEQAVEAQTRLAQTQLIVTALASGLDGSDPAALNLLRLYEFVTHQLVQTTGVTIASARKILATLRDGFKEARPQALALERQGTLPPLSQTHSVQTTA